MNETSFNLFNTEHTIMFHISNERDVSEPLMNLLLLLSLSLSLSFIHMLFQNEILLEIECFTSPYADKIQRRWKKSMNRNVWNPIVLKTGKKTRDSINYWMEFAARINYIGTVDTLATHGRLIRWNEVVAYTRWHTHTHTNNHQLSHMGHLIWSRKHVWTNVHLFAVFFKEWRRKQPPTAWYGEWWNEN